MSKFCSKCGKELFDEAVICPGCGCKAESNNKPINANVRPPKNAKLYFILSGVSALLSLLCAIISHIMNSNAPTGNAGKYMSSSYHLMQNIQLSAAYMFIGFLIAAVVLLIIGIVKAKKRGQ